MLGIDRVADEIAAGDRHQLGLEAAREDARRAVAGGAGDGAAAQCAVDVDVAVGDQLGAGTHRRHDDEIDAAGVDLRAGAHRLRHHVGARSRGGTRRGRRRLSGSAARVRLRAIQGGEIDRLGRAHLQRAGILHANRNEPMPVQELLQRREIGGRGAAETILEIEHHRRLGEKAGAARHLRGDVAIERGIVGIADAHHHQGEDAALYPARHHDRHRASLPSRALPARRIHLRRR